MRKEVFLLLFLAILLINPVFSALNVTSSSPISLNVSSPASSSFNISTNTTENVSLSTGNNYLVYGWNNQTISNRSYSNLTFIIPRSSNLTANLSWTNSYNNLTINLTNLRNQSQTYFNSSGSESQIIRLGANNVSYGVWKASIFGENVSTSDETFNLTIKLLDNRFKINFIDINHKFENKTIGNNTEKNWSFYVDNNSVNSINVSLVSNAEDYINLSLYNSTKDLINSTNTSNGTASLYTTNISEWYWNVSVDNTNTSANFTYNLTIHLSGNNITELGNLTNKSRSLVYFNLSSPENRVVNGNYNSVINITATNNNQSINLNINLSAPILKLRPKWTDNYYIGNQSLESGETETYNTARNLFINLNQKKTFSFLINNTGGLGLTNLNQENSTNLSGGGLSLNFTNISLDENVSAGGTGYLNITIEPPENSSYTNKTFVGWVYLNSSNGQPYTHLNLTLNLNVTNQTLPRLNKINRVYYLESDNLTQINFSVYFYDNQTVGKFWNSSKQYNLSLVNSTNNSQVLQNLTFNVSGGLFSGQVNTTNLTEGKNYTILGNLSDPAKNTADINLTFKLLNNLNLNVTSDLSSIVKTHPFDFEVNVSKLGNLSADNITVCLELPENIINTDSSNCTSIGNINNTSLNSTTWNLNGTIKGDYTINITAYSDDGRFNKTKEQNVVVKYGNLVASLGEDTPDSKQVNSSFKVHVKIENDGTWPASNVDVNVIAANEEKSTDCSSKTINDNSHITCESDSFSFSSTGDKNIYINLTGVRNSTCNGGDCGAWWKSGKIGDITITSPPSDGDGEDGDGGNLTNYDLSFEKPTSSTLTINQGESTDLDVKIKNTGDAKLHDLSLKLIGLNSSYYSITPTTERDLDVGSTLDFDVNFSIPEDFEAKDYSLTLKAISDEKNKTKSITLTVYKLSIEFINLTNVTITQGEQLTKKFKIKNTGERKLHNLYPELSGIIIIPSAKINLSKNTEKEYEINFSISKNEEIGVKEKTLRIISDEKDFSKALKLTIKPCEQEKENINNQYLELLAKYENLTKRLEDAKNQGKNISSLEQQASSLNNSLKKIKDCIEREDYIEAKSEIKSATSTYSSLSTGLQEEDIQSEEGNLFLIVIITLVIVLLGVILAYTYIIPKKRAYIKKIYKFEGGSSFADKIKTTINSVLNPLMKKFKKGKSQDEVLRKKKLKEWRKYYNDLKKNKYGK